MADHGSIRNLRFAIPFDGLNYGAVRGRTLIREEFVTREIDRQPSVLLVSHGFQQAYERGFSNGLAYAGIKVTLVSSDQTDSARIDKRIESLNLRGAKTRGGAP